MRRTATGTLTTPEPARLLDGIAAALGALDLPLDDRRPRAVVSDTGIGTITFRSAPKALSVHLRSDTEGNLHMLREGVLARLDALAGGLSSGLAWSDRPRCGGLPPNVRLVRLVGRKRVGARFLRLRFAAPDLHDFARSGLHLRLLIPPEGRAPAWPVTGADGRTIWPEGEDALHTPAYTIRAVDPVEGWLDVDVLLHGNGPTCGWAERAPEGAEIGLSGPGGGWFPKAAHLVLAGDETALPAIARILETAAPETTGTALIEVERAADVIRLDHPRGLRIRWLRRSAGGWTLETALEHADLGRPGARHVWVAAEKSRIAAIRKHLRGPAGVDKRESYVAAYWTA